MIDLGVGYARDVNERGQVVGTGNGAFVWTADGGKLNLGTLPGGSGGDALDITNNGKIAGYSTTASGETHATLWLPADDTPPSLAVGDVTANATSPSGAVVTYVVTAIDDTDPNPAVLCDPPSGSAFPIGTTTVNCTATDAAGNQATASFTVYVKGAQEQLADLAQAVLDVGPGTSLAAKVKQAQTYLAQHDVANACATLDTFIAQVRAQSGKSIPAATASALVADATRIKAVLGC